MIVLHKGVYLLMFVGLAAGLNRISLKRSLTLRETVENEIETRGLGDESREMFYRQLYEERTLRGDLNVQNLDNMMYYALIEIGTPAQYFNVCLDTGSSDLWVPSSKCPARNLSCYLDDQYNSSGSFSYSADGTPLRIQYGLGNISGMYSRDTVKLGDLSVNSQPFGEATVVDNTFLSDQPSDGILGLGYPNMAGKQPTFLQSLVSQGQIDEPIFSVYLDDDSDENQESFLIFGGADEDLYTGDIVYTPVTRKTHWHFNLEGVSIGDKTANLNQDAIADTGTTLIYGPSDVIDRINDALDVIWTDESGAKYVNCEYGFEGPTVTLNIGGSKFTLEPSEYLIRYDSDICLSGFTTGDRFGIWVIGTVFLRKYYSIYDMTSNRLGFAKAKIPNKGHGISEADEQLNYDNPFLSFEKPSKTRVSSTNPGSKNANLNPLSDSGYAEMVRMIADNVEEELLLKSLGERRRFDSIDDRTSENGARAASEQYPEASKRFIDALRRNPEWIPKKSSWREGTQLSVPVPNSQPGPVDIKVPVQQRQAGPIDTEVPVQQRQAGPIDIEVSVPKWQAGPIDTKVPVPQRQAGPIDTEVPVPKWQAGPIDTEVPVPKWRAGPIDIEVPVPKWRAGPIDIKVPVPQRQAGPIDIEVPVPNRHAVPVDIEENWVPIPKIRQVPSDTAENILPHRRAVAMEVKQEESKVDEREILLGTPERLVPVPHRRVTSLGSRVPVPNYNFPAEIPNDGVPIPNRFDKPIDVIEKIVPVPHRQAIPSENQEWEPKHQEWEPKNQEWQPKKQEWQPKKQEWQPKNQEWKPKNQEWQPKNQKWEPKSQKWQPKKQEWVPTKQEWVPKNQEWEPKNQKWEPKNQEWKPKSQEWQPKNQEWKPKKQEWIPKNQEWEPKNQEWEPKNQKWEPKNQGWQPKKQEWEPKNQEWEPKNQEWKPKNQEWQPKHQVWQPKHQDWQPKNQKLKPKNQEWEPKNQEWQPIPYGQDLTVDREDNDVPISNIREIPLGSNGLGKIPNEPVPVDTFEENQVPIPNVRGKAHDSNIPGIIPKKLAIPVDTLEENNWVPIAKRLGISLGSRYPGQKSDKRSVQVHTPGERGVAVPKASEIPLDLKNPVPIPNRRTKAVLIDELEALLAEFP